jgi:hypothetical protein
MSSDHGNVTIYSIRHANDLPWNLMAVLVTAPTERLLTLYNRAMFSVKSPTDYFWKVSANDHAL